MALPSIIVPLGKDRADDEREGFRWDRFHDSMREAVHQGEVSSVRLDDDLLADL